MRCLDTLLLGCAIAIEHLKFQSIIFLQVLQYRPDGIFVLGFFIGIPNLSRSFRRAGGSLFPTGFWHILREYRNPETVEFLLAAARPGLPSAQLTGLTFVDMYDTLRRRGVRYMETNRELEDNASVSGIWLKFKVPESDDGQTPRS